MTISTRLLLLERLVCSRIHVACRPFMSWHLDLPTLLLGQYKVPRYLSTYSSTYTISNNKGILGTSEHTEQVYPIKHTWFDKQLLDP